MLVSVVVREDEVGGIVSLFGQPGEKSVERLGGELGCAGENPAVTAVTSPDEGILVIFAHVEDPVLAPEGSPATTPDGSTGTTHRISAT